MASIKYDGKRIIPAPFFSVTKTYDTDGSDLKIGSTFNITLQGDLFPFKGSPTSTDIYETSDMGYPLDEVGEFQFDKLIRKQNSLRNLFSEEGREFVVIGCEEIPIFRCYPRVTEINFPEGLWVQRMPYTVSLVCDWVSGDFLSVDPSGEDGFTKFIKSREESWNIETLDDQRTWDSGNNISLPTFSVTHNLSAVGKRTYDHTGLLAEPWENAKSYVLDSIGFDSSYSDADSLINIPIIGGGSGYQPYNHIRTEILDIAGGSYAVNETWILSSGSAIEDFTITATSGNEDARKSVTIDGTIRGLDVINYETNPFQITVPKYTNAINYWNNSVYPKLQERAELFSNILDLNSVTVSSSIASNVPMGVISYNFSFDNRSQCITGEHILNENIEINDTFPTDIYAVVPIIGRVGGSLIQVMQTTTNARKAVTVELTVEVSGCVDALSAPTWLVNEVYEFIFNETTGVYSTLSSYDIIVKSQDNSSWNKNSGRYFRDVEWELGNC